MPPARKRKRGSANEDMIEIEELYADGIYTREDYVTALEIHRKRHGGASSEKKVFTNLISHLHSLMHIRRRAANLQDAAPLLEVAFLVFKLTRFDK